MKAILLLAGRSRRFAPLKEKSLFPLCGKTLAEHQVETLRQGGCTDITLVVGAHNKKELKKLLPDLPQVEQKDLDLGMQGACLSVLPKMKGEPVLIVSGNDVVEPDAIRMVIKEAKVKGVAGAILARKVKAYFPGGYLTVKGGNVTGIVEKPGVGKEPSKLVNIVAHVHNNSSALLLALKGVTSKRDDGYEQALAALFKTLPYHAVPYEGAWLPVKHPWHLLALMSHYLGSIRKASNHRSVKIHKSAVIEGNVVIGEGSRILANATIVGPCVIGKNCIIGNGALVRGSSIGDHCVVGYNTEVKGSILAGSVWTHMTYLGDSIIGTNVSFGGGCTTGNLRLDEGEISSMIDGEPVVTGLTKFGLVVGDHCRFGIQVGTNPGISIGEGCFIAGGLFLPESIPAGSFVMMKNGEVQVRPNRTSVAPASARDVYRKAL